MIRVSLTLLFVLGLLASCAAPVPQIAQPSPIVTQGLVPDATSSPIRNTPLPPSSPTPTGWAPTATVEPTLTPTPTSEAPPGWIAYTGVDENIWLINAATGEKRQVTQDAMPNKPGVEKETITYCCAQWSSDGRLLAYQRELGTPISSGYHYLDGLWVYDVISGAARQVLENQDVVGYTWKPLTHLIAYALPVAQGYFTKQRGQLSAKDALGIWALNIDEGDPFELVQPQRGFSLVNPKWSKDGRFLAFDEVLGMEGRGQFAHYDFEAKEYVAWDRVIGSYDWAPDSRQIAYDELAYVPSGTERIWLSDRLGKGEQAFSPQYNKGYAFNPVFSPQGDKLAYLAALNGPESNQYTLFVQPLETGEPRSLGVFEQAGDLAWSPDGKQLTLFGGPYEERQVQVVTIANGSVMTLAKGNQPAWQPFSP